MTGRIDTHAHLISGVDDGCASIEQSLACARGLVAAGYTHAVCTPHIWPNLPRNTAGNIRRWTADLQAEYDRAGVPLRLFPGGELSLQPFIRNLPPDQIPTCAMAGRHVLIDLWAERLPEFFHPLIRWLQSLDLTVILAHPERMRAIQDGPEMADELAEMGLLLQGNLQCFADRPAALTRRTAERFLAEDRYFMLGTDLHAPEQLPARLSGLQRAIDLAGPHTVDRLTIHNPRSLLPDLT